MQKVTIPKKLVIIEALCEVIQDACEEARILPSIDDVIDDYCTECSENRGCTNCEEWCEYGDPSQECPYATDYQDQLDYIRILAEGIAENIKTSENLTKWHDIKPEEARKYQ